MLIISKNIENPDYSFEPWYQNLQNLLDRSLNTTEEFEKYAFLGLKIQFDSSNPVLPNGLTIPENSNITLEALSTVELEVIDVLLKGNDTIIKTSVREI